MPTNISHSGAKTEEEAKRLIESLMMGKSTESPDLPAPLIPPSASAGVSSNPATAETKGNYILISHVILVCDKYLYYKKC